MKTALFCFSKYWNKGKVKKEVEFSEMNVNNFYNLSFGDYDEQSDTRRLPHIWDEI